MKNERKIEEFVVINHSDVVCFNQIVNGYLSKGFCLRGETRIQFCILDNQPNSVYAQVMVKYEDERTSK